MKFQESATNLAFFGTQNKLAARKNENSYVFSKRKRRFHHQMANRYPLSARSSLPLSAKKSPRAALPIPACGVAHPRVRRLSSPRAAFVIPACGVCHSRVRRLSSPAAVPCAFPRGIPAAVLCAFPQGIPRRRALRFSARDPPCRRALCLSARISLARV